MADSTQQLPQRSAVAFHFNAPDKLVYACRFARKALRQEVPVLVTGPMALLERLDSLLWQMAPTDFVAHCLDGASPEIQAASPIVLTAQPQLASALHTRSGVLLNLGPDVPQGAQSFARVVEVVGMEEADRVQARQRWRHYASLGCEPERFDLASQPRQA